MLRALDRGQATTQAEAASRPTEFHGVQGAAVQSSSHVNSEITSSRPASQLEKEFESEASTLESSHISGSLCKIADNSICDNNEAQKSFQNSDVSNPSSAARIIFPLSAITAFLGQGMCGAVFSAKYAHSPCQTNC